MSRRSLRPAAVAVVLVFGLLACGGDEDDTATSTPSVEPPAAEPTPAQAEEDPAASEGELDEEPLEDEVAFEGSVTTADGKFVEYPGGFRLTFARAENRPDDDPAYDGDTSADDRIRFTILAENKGNVPVTVDPDTQVMVALGGVNQFELEASPEYMGSDEAASQLPNRVMPGTQLEIYETFSVPEDMRDALAVTVNSAGTFSVDEGYFTPYTFLDVEALLQ